MKNKNLKYYLIVWSLALVAFNLITFIIPNEVMGIVRYSNAAFWVSYALITLSFVAQLLCSIKLLTETDKQRVFLKLPLFTTSFIVTGISLVIGLIFMNIPVIPAWIGAIVCILATVYYAVGLFSCLALETNVANVNQQTKQKVSFMENLLNKLEVLIAYTKSEELVKELKKVYEEVKFSDVVSHPKLKEVEDKISLTFNQLNENITQNSDEALIIEQCHILSQQIKERKFICKICK